MRFWQGGVIVPSAALADPTGAVVGGNPLDSSVAGVGLMAEEYFPDGMTEFIFGPRGELTVDASYGKSAFPVPERTLVFPTEDHFVEFMVRTFNARIETDPETGARVPMVSTTTYGIPYAADASGTGLVDVLSPVSTFLGGPAVQHRV